MRIVSEELYDAEEKVDELLDRLASPLLNPIQKGLLQQQIKEAHTKVQKLRSTNG